jgi:hypothetical protein
MFVVYYKACQVVPTSLKFNGSPFSTLILETEEKNSLTLNNKHNNTLIRVLFPEYICMENTIQYLFFSNIFGK